MTTSPVQTAQAGMQQAAQVFGQTATDFSNELQQINTMMASLQASWTGTASRSFNTAMDSWEASFKAIIDKLVDMMEIMGVNTKEYVSAEEEADSAAQSFASALPGV
jgi:ESAT-6 family protein